MIASFRHKFVFIKTQKTGGTTVELVLSENCGPDDIITPLGANDELLRSAGGLPRCRNFADPEIERQWHQLLLAGKKPERVIKGGRRRTRYYAHMSAAAIKANISPDFWRESHKITVVRHPYEVAVSRASYKFRRGKHGTFENFLDKIVNQGKYASFEYYAIENEPVIDTFLRLERLQEDLVALGKKLDIEVPADLPRTKSRYRADKRPAHEILTDKQKETIVNFCRREFDILGYPI